MKKLTLKAEIDNCKQAIKSSIETRDKCNEGLEIQAMCLSRFREEWKRMSQ